jgi:hypothetical protein
MLIFKVSLFDLLLRCSLIASMTLEFGTLDDQKAVGAADFSLDTFVQVVLHRRHGRGKLGGAEVALTASELVFIDLLVGESVLAMNTLDIGSDEKTLQDSIDVDKVWLLDFAAGTHISIGGKRISYTL